MHKTMQVIPDLVHSLVTKAIVKIC